MPTCVERTGTWTNVDGLARRIGIARSAPDGVGPLTDSLARLASRLGPVRAEEVAS